MAELTHELDAVELRAAKLLGTCVETGVTPPGYSTDKAFRGQRERVAAAENERGWRPVTTADAVLGPALWLGPDQPPRFDPFGPHFVAVGLWADLALVWLPERYPDHFRQPTPVLTHPLGRFEAFNEPRRSERAAEALRERAAHYSEVAVLMSDLIGSAAPEPAGMLGSLSMSAARNKGEAIVKRDGWPTSRGKASMRRMAERVGCSYATIRKATEDSPKLRIAFAAAGGSLSGKATEGGDNPELAMLIAEQEMDARSDRG